MVERMAESGKNFVQLHNHTHYSLLDGASKIPNLVNRAKELGMPAVGITDHGNMHGAYEMWSTAVKAGIKPIIGIEAYVTPETARQDKSRVHWGTEAQRSDDVSGGGLITHLTMWAESDEGLVNLMKASSVANLEGRVARYPRMDKEVLSTYSKGVIASSGCPSGIIQTRLRLGQFDEALRAAGEFQDIFGRDNFFIELMDHGLKIEQQVTNDLLTTAGHERFALCARGGPGRAGRDAVHQLGQPPRRPGPFQVRRLRLLHQVGRADARTVQGPARGVRQHAGDRRALQCHVR